MTPFEIVAHRGIPTDAPENTRSAFQRALELGADAVELDVRLTADQVPVVFHYFYLQDHTPLPGAIFDYTYDQLRATPVICRGNPAGQSGTISTLPEILEEFGGKMGLEIEIKGPEPEAAAIIGGILNHYKSLWGQMEVTSYEPALLRDIQELCPGLAADLLFPRTESWMKLDVVEYRAIHLARLAQARAVHLHPSQLTEKVAAGVRAYGIEIHAWDVNDTAALDTAVRLDIRRICTDQFDQAYRYRENLRRGQPG